MARRPEDRDDSDELPRPKAEDVDRILSGVIPQTPDRLKEKTRATRGQDYARYEGEGAPAKARRADTLDVAGPIVADDTNVDGLQLTEDTIARIERRREEEAQRNDSTVSVDRPLEPKRRSAAGLWLALALVGAVLVWIGWQAFTTTNAPTPIAPVTATSVAPLNTAASSAVAPINSTPSASTVATATVTASSSPPSTALPPSTAATVVRSGHAASSASAPTASAVHTSSTPASSRPDILVNP